MSVAENGAVYLAQVLYRGLDKDSVRIVECVRERIFKSVGVMRLADADARTEVYRLDDNGIAEFLFDIRNYLFRSAS